MYLRHYAINRRSPKVEHALLVTTFESLSNYFNGMILINLQITNI